MTVTVQLDEKAVKETEEACRKAELPDSQRNIIAAMAAKLRDYIRVSDTVMQGLILIAADDWQRKRGKPISGVETMNPVEQVEFILGTLGLLRERVIEYLQDGTDVVFVDKGIAAALEFYKKALSASQISTRESC